MKTTEETTDLGHGVENPLASPDDATKILEPKYFGPGISPQEIRGEVARVVASEDFPASARNRRVLEYVVESTLQGLAWEVTAYNIATRVYGRSKGFEPRKDPIVRIEMAHLRRDLETYYLKSGRGNPLRLGIPKGGYHPKVTRPLPDAGNGGSVPVSPFIVSVLRAALCAWSGAGSAAAAAWQDLLLADPNMLANLHGSVRREVADEEVAGLIVEGVLRSARQTT